MARRFPDFADSSIFFRNLRKTFRSDGILRFRGLEDDTTVGFMVVELDLGTFKDTGLVVTRF